MINIQKIIYISATLLLLLSCNLREKRLQEELTQSIGNAKQNKQLMQLSDEELLNYRSKELVELAINFYTAAYKSDTIAIAKTIQVLDYAINKEPSNFSAYSYKIDILTKQGKYSKAISAIDEIFKAKGYKYAEGLMYKGVLYDLIDSVDSANIYYNEAVEDYNIKIKNNSGDEVSNKVNKAVVYCLLGQTAKATEEINSLIKQFPKSDMPKHIKERIIVNFEKDKFIKDTFL